MNDKDILNALHDYYEESIFITDGDGNILFANKMAAENMNSTCDELEGSNVNMLLQEGLYSHSTTIEAIKTKEPSVGAIMKGQDDPSTVSNSIPILDERGNVKLVVTNNMSVQHTQEWDTRIKSSEIEKDRLKRELDYLKLQDKRILIANSTVMQNVLNNVDAIAPTDSSVVILGESGTGKDMIARLIHDKSQRSKHAFISINCAAMPETLLESELFGYEAGAFTGANTKGKMGLFEATSGGTLFLDEIGEMSLAMQSRLLRVLENQEIRRVGGVKNIPVDVRIICATTRDLQGMIQENKFREDLYYRLSVFTLHLPSLKKRPDDILPIAQMFLDGLNKKYGTNKVFAEVSLETMQNHDWPGNIRELRNVVERIYVISQNNELVFTPVPTAYYVDSEEGKRELNLIDREFSTLKEFTEYAEINYIKQIMQECDNSVQKTADRLGIHRSVLYRKLHKAEK